MRSPLSTSNGRGGWNGWFMLEQGQAPYVPFFPPFSSCFVNADER